MIHWLVYTLACKRRGHRWGEWRPASELLPGRTVPSDWLARRCERGCGHYEMPQPGL